MTTLNTWQRAGVDGSEQLFASLQCDGCFPPRFVFGSASAVAGYGWRFDELRGGTHRCPACPSSGTREPSASLRTGDPALPNLLVVGAAKAGTTSLHSYLSAHPEIQMPEVKELRFFQDPHWEKRLDRYAELFDGRAPVRGEATPAYTCYPLIPGVPERMHELVAEAKLIYIVRDPVERAIAAYAEAQAGDKEARPADEALADVEDPYNPYLAQSRYAMQAERYLAVFPRERLLVLHQEDLLARRAETLRQIFRFLDVDEEFKSSRFAELANTRIEKRRRNRVGRALRRSSIARAMRHIPERPRAVLLRSARRVMSRPVVVTVAPDVRARLGEALDGELDQVTALAGSSSAPVS